MVLQKMENEMSEQKINVYELQSLFDTIKGALLWAWYLSGIIIGAALWFFPIPQSNLQTFAFAGAFMLYTAISVVIAKVDRVKGELKR